MSEPLERLLQSPRVSLVEAEVEGPHLLLFTGDPDQRVETSDVAVIARQLLAELGELRLGVVARHAEKSMRERYGVKVVPSLVSPSSGRLLPKVAAWDDYRALAKEALAASTKGGAA